MIDNDWKGLTGKAVAKAPEESLAEAVMAILALGVSWRLFQ
jgi:hypothetical protein